MTVLLQRAEVEGEQVDVRLDGEVVSAIGQLAPLPDEEVIDAAGGAVLPGLHDHHIHLLALAAAQASVDVGSGLAPLARVPGTGWLRAVGWTGDGDRFTLDAVRADRPVRVQHRSGALWVVNSRGVEELALRDVDLPGVERDLTGEPTGRLWRLDAWLGARIGREAPDLEGLGRRLARLGLTGLTDATPDLDRETCTLLRRSLPQELLLLGDPEGEGPVKIVLPDHELPSLEELITAIASARPRPVAVHCVTREALALLLAALREVGATRGDRVEHGALIPLDVSNQLPAVVTQPGFLLDRGDDYLRDVDSRDLPDLYRYRTLLDQGCPVVPSSDAPYGPVDPWTVMRAARDRRTASGTLMSAADRVSVADALDGMLRPLHDLQAPARRVVSGAPADLVLLHTSLPDALADPDSGLVRATWREGRRIDE
ncbi:MAG: amidohydrolase family protein [Mycobacteriales bacterium]